MNKISILRLIAFNFLVLIFLQSCSKDEVSVSGSRKVKYEITGDFSGSIDVVAVVGNGSFEAIEVKKLPWIYEFTADKTLTQLSITASGNSGKTGQKATLKVYVGDKEVSSGSGTASNGFIFMNLKAYVF
ncbi:MAG: hypothetical protein U5N85_14120 [Arcicella sp.]|nr:hypothetical protein [Arcicella sp.]